MSSAPPVLVFRGREARSHAPFAVAGAVGYYVVSGTLMGAGQRPGLWGLLHFVAFAWFFGGPFLSLWLARRADEALAAMRGDARPLARPERAALGAFIGVTGAFVAFIVAALSRENPWPHAVEALGLVSVTASYTVARLLGRTRPVRRVELWIDALRYDDGWRTEVVPWREITALTPALDHIQVHRRGAPTLQVATIDADLFDAIQRQVIEGQRSLAVGAALRRDDRTISAWRDAVYARSKGAVDLRAQAIDRDDLLDALEHPAATTEERVGAALALRDLGDDGPSRIRRAAEGVLDAETREALRAVADGRRDARVLERVTRRG